MRSLAGAAAIEPDSIECEVRAHQTDARFVLRRASGEPITARLTEAPGNKAPLGGLKVVTDGGWFAARPSGTEDVYKVYAESFRGEDHLRRIVDEAQAIVDQALAAL